MKSYCVVRFPRAGLGNRLIPWARAEVFADRHQLDFVQPQWLQLKVGPLLRGESDLRLYGGQFRQRVGALPRWSRGWLPARKIVDPDMSDSVIRDGVSYIFSDHTRLFADLIGHRSLLKDRLWQVTRSNVWAKVESIGQGTLTVHIRLGDFRSIPGMASSIEWYAKTVHDLLSVYPALAPALVFSDASNAEISPVLDHPKVKRVTTGYALGDLLALSRGRVLVASGNSSFSAWASYLSESPTCYEPGHDLRGFFNFSSEVNWLYEAGDPQYLDALKGKLDKC